MRNERKTAIWILFIGAALSVLFCSGRLIVNTTASVPLGFWHRVNGHLSKGDVVKVPVEAFKATDWVPEAYWRKNGWGRIRPFLKRVEGLPGDIIETVEYGLIQINGQLILNSAPLSADRAGRMLKAFPLPITLASDEVWLLSDSPRGFDSRYLGPARMKECRRVVPIFTW